MEHVLNEPGDQLMLDGNAAAGLLQEIFGDEMTAHSARCAHCGRRSMIGALLAFGREMGTVLRCPHCLQVMLRAVERPDGILLDMQGMAYLHMRGPGG
jgi:hypothetical protein